MVDVLGRSHRARHRVRSDPSVPHFHSVVDEIGVRHTLGCRLYFLLVCGGRSEEGSWSSRIDGAIVLVEADLA